MSVLNEVHVEGLVCLFHSDSHILIDQETNRGGSFLHSPTLMFLLKERYNLRILRTDVTQFPMSQNTRTTCENDVLRNKGRLPTLALL